MSRQTWHETSLTQGIDGTALTAAAAATMLPASAKTLILQPRDFYIEKQFWLRATGRISSANPTPGTARFDLRFGATVVWDSLAILLDTAAAATTVGWILDVLLTVRAVGSSANMIGQGTWTATNVKGVGTMPLGTLVAVLPWNSAPAVGSNFDSSATQAVDLFFTQTVATGSLTCHQASLTQMN